MGASTSGMSGGMCAGASGGSGLDGGFKTDFGPSSASSFDLGDLGSSIAPSPAPSASGCTTSSTGKLLAALNNGNPSGAPRSLLIEMLRLAADPQNGARGEAWVRNWSVGPQLTPAAFHQICSSLQLMMGSGTLPPGGLTPLPDQSFSMDGAAAAGMYAPPLPALAAAPEPAAAPPYSELEGSQYRKLFGTIAVGGRASRQAVSETMARANLPPSEMGIIWALCDLDADGYLDEEEMLISLHLAADRFKGNELPTALPRAWLTPAKRRLLHDDGDDAGVGLGGGFRPGGDFGGGGFSGDGAAERSPSEGGSDDFQVAAVKKKSIFGLRASLGGAKSKKGTESLPPTGANAWPSQHPTQAGGGSAYGGGDAAADTLQSSAYQFGDPNQKITVQFGGGAPRSAASEGTHQEAPVVDPNHVSRSGALVTTAGSSSSSKKPRWVVLGVGQLAIYSDKKDFGASKPPKCTLDMRTDVGRVMCTSLNAFTITLSQEIKDSGKKGKLLHKAGDNLQFSLDDSKELTGWVNDLTNVWKAYQAAR